MAFYRTQQLRILKIGFDTDENAEAAMNYINISKCFGPLTYAQFCYQITTNN